MSYSPSPMEQLLLVAAFASAAEAGYGIWDGSRFEAYPGMNDAAADFIEARLLGGE